MKSKEVLRKKMREKLDYQKQTERRRKSSIIQKKLFAQKEFLTSKCVMVYISKGMNEVETGPIIKKAFLMGKKVAAPVTLVRDKMIKPVYLEDIRQKMRKGSYGVYEPLESGKKRPIRFKDIDLVIVPGIAFDRKNNRLGRGQGYYDRFLKCLPEGTAKIGLGFRFQLLDSVPANVKDISLTSVITN